MDSIKGVFEDFKVNVKIKLSAMWVTVMLLYIYGDIFSLFVPGRLVNLMNGTMGLGTTTPIKLLVVALIMTIPAVMVFVSVTQKPTINRWMNIVFGVLYTAIMVLTVIDSIGTWWIFYLFLGIVEIGITSLIVWQAWTWPRSSSN